RKVTRAQYTVWHGSWENREDRGGGINAQRRRHGAGDRTATTRRVTALHIPQITATGSLPANPVPHEKWIEQCSAYVADAPRTATHAVPAEYAARGALLDIIVMIV
ncbi:hypothetical protein LSAT2_025300, partial [Lamellibrachia satsuma]